MNAPMLSQRPSARDKYIPIVKSSVPLCEGPELMFRCSILLLRDQAGSAMNRCSHEAAGVLQEIQSLATLYAFKRMPIDELAELRRQLVVLTAAASGLEMFAYRLAYPDGGANAGG